MSLVDTKKELHVAKRIVKFAVTDGRKPSRTEEVGKPFALKIPIALKLAAGQSRRVKLGLSCNLPTVIVGKQGSLLFSPGKELEVDIVGEGPGQEVLNIGEGEVIAKAFPIDSSGLDFAE